CGLRLNVNPPRSTSHELVCGDKQGSAGFQPAPLGRVGKPALPFFGAHGRFVRCWIVHEIDSNRIEGRKANMSNPTNTIRLHRVFRAPAERVYRAFLDPAAMAKWLPPHGFTATVHEMDARVGGGYRMSFTNFTSGNSHS